MKKFVAYLLALCMIAGLALGGLSAAPKATAEEPQTETVETTEAPAKEEPSVTVAPKATEEGTKEPETSAEPSAAEDDVSETDEPATDDGLTTEAPAETDVPAETEAPVETEAPADAPAETEAAPDYGSGPVYLLEGATKHYGTLQELLPLSNGATIYLYTVELLELNGYAIDDLRQYSFAPDATVFPAEEDYRVIVSTLNPSGYAKDNTVFLWVGKAGSMPTAAPALDDVIDATDEDMLEHEIEAALDEDTLVFTLTAYPELADGMYFAVMLDESEPVGFVGNRYAADVSGEYRFALLAADGTVLARSARFTVVVPEQAPVLLTANMTAEELAPAASDPANAQAWCMLDETKTYGALSELLGQNASTIYLLTSETIVLQGGTAQLSGVRLQPDGDTFGADRVVRVTDNGGSLAVQVTQAEPLTAPTGATITVTPPSTYVDDAWQAAAVTFALSSNQTVDGTTLAYGVAYAAYGSDTYGSPIQLTGAQYVTGTDCKFNVKFVLLDVASGVAVAESDAYHVKIDTTLPLVMASSGGNFVLDITAGDLLSDVTGISIDGGKTWRTPQSAGDGVFTLSLKGSRRYTFAAGMIVAVDEAGNRGSNTKPVTLAGSSIPSGGGSGGTGGAGGSASSRTVYHSASDTEDTTAYNGVELVVPEQTMTRLTVGEETLDLDLVMEENEFLVVDEEEHVPTFTAEFINRSGNEAAGVDTLVLTCADEIDLNGAYTYTWEFTGTVYKKLAASGIDYLALRVGDRVTMLSTAGFSGGVRYNMYRAEGLASKEFRYTVTMGVPGPTFSMTVTVGEDSYAMSADTNSEFYYYDVTTGSESELLGPIQG